MNAGKILTLCLSLICIFNIRAYDAVFFVGAFNGWNINSPVKAFSSEGIYETDIDFSNGDEFKFSTMNPAGSWTTFDEGTLYPVSSLLEDEWIGIQEMKKSPNAKAPARRAYNVRVDLENMRMMFSTGGSSRAPWSGTLPVMFINTENKTPVTSKETYLQASYWIDPMGVEGIEAVASEESPALLQIKGRGNYTWTGFDKKPYRLKLDKKESLLGMDKSKHFALLAHADDQAAGLRNALGFAASVALNMPWTPATEPLEVVLNGDYIGLYWLTETIRVDKDRVDVVEQEDLAVEDVDGGWLVEIDNYDSDPHVTVTDSNGYNIWFTYKSPEILSSEQKSFLQQSMQSIQNALAARDENLAASMVDFDILARYFIANQLMLDMESFHGSCYLNRQRGESEKWKFGPVWDFGNAFNPYRADHPRFIFDHPDFTQVWIGEFYKMPSFLESVKKVWKEFLPNGPDVMAADLSCRVSQIAAAAASDALRWPKYAHSDVEYQASKLQVWLDGSVSWLKEQWGADASVGSLANPLIRIHVEGNALNIYSETETDILLCVPSGISRLIHINVGSNSLCLPSGLYIIDGRKLCIGSPLQ